MRNLFRGKRLTASTDEYQPQFMSGTKKQEIERVQNLFLQASSLDEIIRRYKTQRKFLEEKGKLFEIVEILDKEIQALSTSQKIYKKILEIFSSISKQQADLSSEEKEQMNLKIFSIEKKINILSDQMQFLKTLKNSKTKQFKNTHVSTEFCKNNEHIFKYSKHEAFYVCTRCGYTLSYQ